MATPPFHDMSQQPGVLLHLGKPYAVGLLWFTLQVDGDEKKQLAERLQKTGADFHCLRSHMAQQQGFGWLAKGHRRGMKVAAAMVADQLVGEWHGVFEADNGWWYVQVRSDTIPPQGDRFFTSEEEAFQVFQTEAQAHNWPHAYAPSRWQMPEGNVRTLELKNLLDGLATTTLTADNLTAVFGSTVSRNSVLGGILATFVLMAGIAAFAIFKEPEPIVLPQPIKFTPKPIPVLEPVKADTAELVAPDQFLAACGQAASVLFTSLPGWSPFELVCNANGVSLSWQQQTGSFTDARDQGAQLWPQNSTIKFVNRILSVSVPAAQLSKTEQASLLSQEEALQFLEQTVQPMGGVQVQVITPPAPKPIPVPPGGAGAKPPTAPIIPLPYLDVIVTTGYAPDAVSALYHVPGLSVTEAKWTIPQGTWTYHLTILHQRLDTPAAPSATSPPANSAIPKVSP